MMLPVFIHRFTIIQLLLWGLVLYFAIQPNFLHAQGPLDGFLKGKGHLDLAPSFSSNSAKVFLDGQEQSFNFAYRGSLLSLFAEYGLNENLDLVATGSYLFNPTRHGLQDGGVFAKYRFVQHRFNNGFTIHALAGSGLAFPLTNYEAIENGALGAKAVVLPARLIVQVETPIGLFFNASGGYNWRLDAASAADVARVRQTRPDFQPIAPANFTTLLLKMGFPAAHYYFDAWFEWQNTQGGANFMPNEADLPQLYGVSYRQLGGTAFYSDNGKNGFYLSTGYVLGGRNVGRTFRITSGVVLKFPNKI